jgi:adenylosuccinate lyase
VIPRYTRPEIGAVWTDEAKLESWRQVEVACALETEGPTPAELEAISLATFTVDAVLEREKITDHDVAAFVDVLSASAGEAGRWIHYGLTSSDVLFAFEADRNLRRLEAAVDQVSVGAVSGAVGTYSATSPDFERRVLARLGLEAEPVSTQVVARDRHAEFLQAIALAGAGLERFATEIRHLQRTEVREVEEPFRAGAQKGSSAMPHKRNPITSERITGLARVLRGYAQVGVEDVALWHERDISHSGAERVVLPDATIALDYMYALATRLARGMVVHADRMRENIDLTYGALFSQRVLLALVAGGLQRDDAYRIAQRTAQQAWDTRTQLRSILEDDEDPQVRALDLDAIFDLSHYTKHAHEIVNRLDVVAPAGEPAAA